MIAQHKDVRAIDGRLDRTPQLTGWLEAWPGVRHEIEALLEQYERRNGQYEPDWTERVIEQMDETLANLAHRAAWLARQLEQPE